MLFLFLVQFFFPFLKVLKRLQSKYGSLYRRDNVILSGTHTHSGPAGFFQYTVFVIASEGFSNRTFEHMVTGIMKVGKEPQRQLFFTTARSVLGVDSCTLETVPVGSLSEHSLTTYVSFPFLTRW